MSHIVVHTLMSPSTFVALLSFLLLAWIEKKTLVL